MNNFEKDYKFGMSGERKIYDILQKKFPNNNIKKSEQYQYYDFEIEGKNLLIEVKNRNISKNRYKTTMFGYDKLQRFKAFNNKNGNKYSFIVIFIFKDGIYYHKHTKNYNYDIQLFGRNNRNNVRKKDYIFIPVIDLLKFN